MNVKTGLFITTLTLAAPIAVAQQGEMPESPVVSTAEMVEASKASSESSASQAKSSEENAAAEASESTDVARDEFGRPVDSGEVASQPEEQSAPADSDDGPAPEGTEAQMPAAPSEVLSNGVPSAKPLAKGQKVHEVERISEKKEAPQYKTSPLEVNTSFGQNELINVSMGHPNRIVTPFMKPNVLKIDEDAIVSVKQNVIYFASDKRAPVTLHVRESGSEEQSISLTLLPQKIPPREVVVNIPGHEVAQAMAYGATNEEAKRWEESEPYEQTLVNLMTALAKGDIPQGYRIRDFQSADVSPVCQQRGLRFAFERGQVIAGNNLQVYVGVVRNIADQGIEFVETNCASQEVASVAAWPDVYLAPGQATEVFVVDKAQQRKTNTKRRQSLIGGR